MSNAGELLELALEGHGGLDRWRSAREVVARVSAGGFALRSKFRSGFRAVEQRASTTEPRLVITPYPGPGRRGVLEGERVRIETDGGGVVAERTDPRPFFRGRRNLWWDDLDVLYFAGYAMWNYLGAPFLLTRPGFELREVEPWEEEGDRWRRLHVTFPPDVPTHSREQVFYFDDRGLLRRLDYTAEVFGSWARAAHYCFDHRDFGGLVVPTRRRVTPRRRNGDPLAHPVLVWIWVGDVRLV